eukprot:m.44431 g.44431  ORF g.44431 m.44431 type:complete len:335 (-) comp6522_c0_seq1:149-1153(-)
MGLSVSRVDTGLFVAGVEALEDVDKLRDLGITHVLNVAQEELYSRSYRTVSPDDEATSLSQVLRANFTVKVMNTHDHSTQDLSPFFEDMSSFIAAGRAAGGVVVHCAAGVSRATTATVAYLVLREKLSVNAAFAKVYHVRPQACPNEGFWIQLRNLETTLIEQGVTLRDLRPGELRDLSQAEEPPGGAQTYPPVDETIKRLDDNTTPPASPSSVTLTAMILLHQQPSNAGSDDGTPAPETTKRLLTEWNDTSATKSGMRLTDVTTDQRWVSCRVSLTASSRSTAAASVRTALDTALRPSGLIKAIAVEGQNAQQPRKAAPSPFGASFRPSVPSH